MGRRADYLPSSNSEFNNAWSYTSIRRRVYGANIICRDNVTLSLLQTFIGLRSNRMIERYYCRKYEHEQFVTSLREESQAWNEDSTKSIRSDTADTDLKCLVYFWWPLHVASFNMTQHATLYRTVLTITYHLYNIKEPAFSPLYVFCMKFTISLGNISRFIYNECVYCETVTESFTYNSHERHAWRDCKHT